MSKDSYEFAYMSDRERQKLVITKTLVFISVIYSLWQLVVSDGTPPHSDYFNAAWILGAVFVYINLMTVRSELIEIFEPPVEFRGKEFAWASSAIFCAGLYFQFFS